METLELQGIKVIPFAFPYDRDPQAMRLNLYKLMDYFGVSENRVQKEKQRLDQVRRLCWTWDEMTWKDNQVSGYENHNKLVSTSDFEGNPDRFAARNGKAHQPGQGAAAFYGAGTPGLYRGTAYFHRSLSGAGIPGCSGSV